jgi:hypothetical protein
VIATGKWTYAEGRKCGPDGDPTLGFSPDVLVTNAPRGALIAKVGGSAADKPDTSHERGYFSVRRARWQVEGGSVGVECSSYSGIPGRLLGLRR